MFELISAKLSPAKARTLSRASIKLAAMIFVNQPPLVLHRTVMGLSFPSPVGLAAGYDKHGELYQSLPPLGFGFAEIGSAILLPEKNRSAGIHAVEHALSCLNKNHLIPLGISISINRNTPFNAMAAEYVACMQRLWQYADYFTINLGVRAGPDLHLTEHRNTLLAVLAAVKTAQNRLAQAHNVYHPLAVKIDQTRGVTSALLDCVKSFSFDGIILGGEIEDSDTNTALKQLENLANSLAIPIISVGGIRTPQDALNRLSAGASLIQLYSGLVQSGPLLPSRINAYLAKQSAYRLNYNSY